MFLNRCKTRRAIRDCDLYSPDDAIDDQNWYEYRAGPVSMWVGRRCVHAVGGIEWRGRHYYARTTKSKKYKLCSGGE